MENSLALKFPRQSRKSGEEVVTSLSSLATTHGAFARLKRRVQANSEKYYRKQTVSQFVVLVQCRRHREWFKLGPDLDLAVKRARDIQQHLRLHGWDDTRRKFKPAFESELCDLTIGVYLGIVEQHGQFWPPTFHGYAAKLRRMVSVMRGIRYTGGDKHTGSPAPSKWRLAVDRVLLNSITPTEVAAWRDNYVARHPAGSAERTRAEHSANTILRNARTLFSKRTLRRILLKRPDLVLPSPLPFENVEFLPERESDYFYHSEIDAKQLIADAFRELAGNRLVIFVLGIGAGLRRSEMDHLPWTHVDLPKGVITIAPTKYSRLKSDHSVGKIQLEARFAEVLRQHAAATHGEFVLASAIAPRLSLLLNRHCRCKKDFEAVCAWLRNKGIKRSTSCIHTLRKEFGSHIAQRRGIFAASAALRHSTIGVTRKYYVSSHVEPTSFFTPEAGTGSADALQLLDQLKQALEQKPTAPVPALAPG